MKLLFLMILFVSQIQAKMLSSQLFMQFRENVIIDKKPITTKEDYSITECCLECQRTPNCTFAQTVTDPSGVKTTCSLFGEIADVCSYLEPHEGGMVFKAESQEGGDLQPTPSLKTHTWPTENSANPVTPH